MSTSKIYHGDDARKQVSKLLKRPLTELESYIVGEEGYSAGDYKDTKGITTSGVGQVGGNKGVDFPTVLSGKVDVTRGLFKNYEGLPFDLQKHLVGTVYRGNAEKKHKWVKLLNEGKYDEAADEFLDHEGYRESKKEGTGIYKRMDSTADAMRRYGDSQKEVESDKMHTVKPGDTLYGIAKKSGVTVDQLLAHNLIKDPNLIYPGQVIHTVPEIAGLKPVGVSSSGRQEYSLVDKFKQIQQASKEVPPVNQGSFPARNTSGSGATSGGPVPDPNMNKRESNVSLLDVIRSLFGDNR